MSKRSTVSDRLYQDMRTKISSGEWPGGFRLVHRQLAAEYDTSQIPVIEGLRRLESDGLVTNTAGLGARVREWTKQDVVGLCLLRQALEGTVCRLFAQHATPTECFTLGEYGRRMDERVETHPDDSVSEDLALHLHIAKCSRSSVLHQFVENSCVIVATMSSRFVPPVGAYVGEHDELIAALLSRDPDKAEQAGRKHMERVLHSLMNGE